MEQKCNIIYIFSMSFPHLEGQIKIAQTVGTFDVDPISIPDDDPRLVYFAKKGIEDLASTASSFCKLLYCTVGITNKTHKSVSVEDVYQCLKLKGILPAQPSSSNAWYKISLKKAVRAIRAVKNENLNFEAKD